MGVKNIYSSLNRSFSRDPWKTELGRCFLLITYPHLTILHLYRDYNHPAGIYLLKVKNRNTGTMCEIC